MAIIAVLAAADLIARGRDLATPDERAVLTEFTNQLQQPDCEPMRTSVFAERPRPGLWLEVGEKEGALLDTQYRNAEPRDQVIMSGKGLMLPALQWLLMRGNCTDPLAVSTPAIVGDRAFVTARSAKGVSAAVYVRKAVGWRFLSMAADGNASIQY